MNRILSFPSRASALVMIAFSTLLSAESITWTNLSGGSWHAAENWSPNLVPSANDAVTIPGGVAISITGAASVNGLNLGSGSSLLIEAGAVLNLDGADTRSIYGPVTNRGTINWLNGHILVYGTPGGYSGEIRNEAGGVIDIQCNQSLSSNFSSPWAPLVNAGTIRKTAGGGLTDCTMLLDTTGVVTCTSGTLRFLSGGTLGGILEAAADCAVQFNGGNVIVAGTQDWRGPGEVKVIASTVLLNLNSGSIVLKDVGFSGDSRLGGGTLTLQGSVVPSGASLTVEAGAVLDLDGTDTRSFYGPVTNRGTINWLNGHILVYGTPGGYSGEIRNEAGGVIDIQCNQSLSSNFSNPWAPLVNAGTIRKTAGGGLTDCTMLLDTTGVVTCTSGTLRFLSGGALGGILRRAPEVTVTRRSDSLCQKGCYPMAHLFWVNCSRSQVCL